MPQTSNNEVDILVVGAGPTGLVMAAEGIRHGMRCRIIDKSSAPSDKSKALAVQARTLEVFQAMNTEIVEEALTCGQPMHNIDAYADNRLIARMKFDGLDSPYPFPLILEQSETERIIYKHLKGLGLEIERESELLNFKQDEESVIATICHPGGYQEILRTTWLVGCDGAHSTVRHLLGLPFDGAPYEEEFVLADLRINWTVPSAQGYFFFSNRGVLGVLPMNGEKRYRLIASRDKSALSNYANPSLKEMRKLFNLRVPLHAELNDPLWLTTFRLHRRIVPKLRVGRVFLAGDAAHIHSPAGGQGMNTGIQDAFNLAWKLALTKKGTGRPILLDSYHEERYPIAKAVLRGTNLLFRIFFSTGPLVIKLVKIIATLVLNRGWFQRQFRNSISELNINYRYSPIVKDCASGFFKFKLNLSAGDRAPDGSVTVFPNKINTSLFDLLRGTRFTALIFCGINSDLKSCRNLVNIARAIQDKYSQNINVYLILASSIIFDDLDSYDFMLLDSDNNLHYKYKARSNCLYLVRPDGYIGFRSQPLNTKYLENYLSKIFYKIP
jgi:2-polyprenyl-6-methoxyphenol hydroxylase-like FAD-dependent oxidoreductase